MSHDFLTPAQGTEGYSFCETIFAGGNTPWHIRKLTDAGPKYTGGADSPTLCGKVMTFGGWDLPVPMSQHHLSHVCEVCAAKLKGKP